MLNDIVNYKAEAQILYDAFKKSSNVRFDLKSVDYLVIERLLELNCPQDEILNIMKEFSPLKKLDKTWRKRITLLATKDIILEKIQGTFNK